MEVIIVVLDAAVRVVGTCVGIDDLVVCIVDVVVGASIVVVVVHGCEELEFDDVVKGTC